MNKINKFEGYAGFLPWLMAILLVALTAGCGGGGDGGRDPILGTGAGSTVACVPAVGATKTITAYTFPTSTLTTIVEVANTIAVTVPLGTNVTALVATFTTTGTGVTVGAVTQVSGTTANNFTAPVVYTVTAADCTTRIYTVTVTVSTLAAASCNIAGTPVDMGAAANFGVLVGPAGGATLTCALPLTVNGDVGAASQSCIPSQGVGFNNFTGVDAPYVAAKAAMLTAIGCAEGRLCDFNYGAATDFAIQPQPLAAGVHCVTGAMSVGSNMTLSNPGVYIFRSSGDLTPTATITIAFGGAANATNTSVFWVPQGAASIGATNTWLGTIMPGSSAASTLGANVTLAPGRVFSNSDVTIGGTSTITIP